MLNIFMLIYAMRSYNMMYASINLGESMSDDPVVRLAAPGVRIPYGFHADWIPHDKLMAHMMR